MEVVTNVPKKTVRSKSKVKDEILDRANEILRTEGMEAMNRYLDENQAAEEQEAREEDGTESAPSPAPAQAEKESRHANPRNFSQEGVPDIVRKSGSDLSQDIEKVISKSPVAQNGNLPAVKVRTLQDTIKLLQPKSVVLANSKLNEWQENILTLIMEQLQGYMSKTLNLLRPDILGEITVRINCNEIAGDDKKKAIALIEKLMSCKFEFWWQLDTTTGYAPKGTKKIETKGIIISTMHNYVGTSYVDLVINKWAFPFLLYYGNGVGGNLYSKQNALIIPGKYAKRLYKTLCGYIDKKTFKFRIDDMRRQWNIPSTYTNAQLRRSIINPAVDTINQYVKNMHVTAEFIVDGESDTRGKTPFDTVLFTIETSDPAAGAGTGVSEADMAAAVTAFLSPLVEEPYRSRLPAITTNWKNHGDLPFVHSKVTYYSDLLKQGKITPQKMKNYLLKAIHDETGTQLRTTRSHRVQEEQTLDF